MHPPQEPDQPSKDRPELEQVVEQVVSAAHIQADALRPEERRKVKCGERHFRDALDVDYRVVTDASELP